MDKLRKLTENGKIPLYVEDIQSLVDTLILAAGSYNTLTNADISGIRTVLKLWNKDYEFVGNMPDTEVKKVNEHDVRRRWEVWAQEQEKMLRGKAKRDNIIAASICLVALVITGINLALLMQ